MLPAVLPAPPRWPVAAVVRRRVQRRCLAVAVLAASLTRWCCRLCCWRPHDGPLQLLSGGGYSDDALPPLSGHNAARLQVIPAGPRTPV